MIKALYGEGDWAIAPSSRLKVISRVAWENMPAKKQEDFFLRVVCGVSEASKKDKLSVLQLPLLPDLTNLTQKEKKEARKDHNESLKIFNELKKAEMLKKSEETGQPVLNVSNQVKKKPNQKTSATCIRSRVFPNRYVKQCYNSAMVFKYPLKLYFLISDVLCEISFKYLFL